MGLANHCLRYSGSHQYDMFFIQSIVDCSGENCNVTAHSFLRLIVDYIYKGIYQEKERKGTKHSLDQPTGDAGVQCVDWFRERGGCVSVAVAGDAFAEAGFASIGAGTGSKSVRIR